MRGIKRGNFRPNFSALQIKNGILRQKHRKVFEKWPRLVHALDHPFKRSVDLDAFEPAVRLDFTCIAHAGLILQGPLRANVE